MIKTSRFLCFMLSLECSYLSFSALVLSPKNIFKHIILVFADTLHSFHCENIFLLSKDLFVFFLSLKKATELKISVRLFWSFVTNVAEPESFKQIGICDSLKKFLSDCRDRAPPSKITDK